MNAIKLFASAVIVAMSAFSATANATIISFDSFEQLAQNNRYMQSYSEDGFTVSGLPGLGLSLAAINSGTTKSYLGSASMYNSMASAPTILTKDGGGTFSLHSIDLSPINAIYLNPTISFIGNIQGGGTVNASFTLNNSFTFQTFAFNGFSNLSSVSWKAVNFSQFDNIVLGASVVSPVPEPEIYTMLLSGFALMGFMMKNRKKSF